ncbi:dihydroorotate dehydrogenase [Candidatus Poribacteria bacterium]|nr:dihydroorotate dehydrogenase [Candidatus Poribacteria bacterium]
MNTLNNSLNVNIGGIRMRNPVMTASGTFGYGSEYADFVDLKRLGAVVVKGVTSVPWSGNPMNRIMETPSGMLNAIGLQNVGVDGFISEKLPYLQDFDVPVIVNVCGKTVKEYLTVVEKLSEAEGVAGIELNISCPNLDCGGMSFGVDANLAHELVKEVRTKTQIPLLVKLSPNVTDITVIARAIEEAGADALSAINTLLGMAINAKTRKPELANVTGGLSGPAIKPVALRLVWEVYKSVSIPIVGMGGIMTGTDAVEFFIAGASAVAIGTANFVNPKASLDVVEGILSYLENANMQSIKELVGSLKVNTESSQTHGNTKTKG